MSGRSGCTAGCRWSIRTAWTEDLASALGLAADTAVWLAVHTNHPRELTAAARAALQRLRAAGIALPVPDRAAEMASNADAEGCWPAFYRALVRLGVKPYYLHHPDLAPGHRPLPPGLGEGRAIVRALRGRLLGLAQPTYVLDNPRAVSQGPGHRRLGERRRRDRLDRRRSLGREAPVSTLIPARTADDTGAGPLDDDRSRRPCSEDGARSGTERAMIIGTQRTFLKFLAVHLPAARRGPWRSSAASWRPTLAGLRGLMLADEMGWLALVLLFFGLTITFGSVAMGVGIMSLGRERDGRHNSRE